MLHETFEAQVVLVRRIGQEIIGRPDQFRSYRPAEGIFKRILLNVRVLCKGRVPR